MNTKLLVNGKLVKGKGEEQNVLNPATGKGDRVGFKFLEAQGGAAARKVRFFKSNGEVVDV